MPSAQPTNSSATTDPGDTGSFLALMSPANFAVSDPKAPKVVYREVKKTDLEKLCDELSSKLHLGRPVELLTTYGSFGIEGVIEQIAKGPPDPKIFTPAIVDQLGRLGIMPLLERSSLAPEPGRSAVNDGEFVLAIRAQSGKDGSLAGSSFLSVPIRDHLFPWAEKKGILHRLTFMLVSGDDYQRLGVLRTNPEERKKFMREIDPEKSARITLIRVLEKAVSMRASDVHIEPIDEKEARIRYRIDGVLQAEPHPITAKYGEALVNIVKGLANLNYQEKRLPQDGAITLTSFRADPDPARDERKAASFLEGRGLRISTMPTPHGESCAIRVLESADVAALSLDDMRMPDDIKSTLRLLLDAPNGVILVAGPTGSGKSTTLSACLRELNKPGVKIVTVEDPVEQEQRGITQTQIRQDLDYTFASALRSVLRHDPDIVLLGEVRDDETAKIMTQGANTGHLMLSTIHTNDSISVLKRLRELGIEEFQIQESLLAVLSQRLVRCLCTHCKEPYDARAELNKLFRAEYFPSSGDSPTKAGEGLKDPNAIVLWRPGSRERVSSCRDCRGIGYRGRIAVPELWVLGDDEKDLISKSERGHRVFYDAALKNGLVPMSVRGFEYAMQGITDLTEIKGSVLRPDELISRREMFKKFILENKDRWRGKVIH